MEDTNTPPETVGSILDEPCYKPSDVSVHYRRVQRFMGLAKQFIPSGPWIMDEATRILRARIILEECIETIRDGLGIDVLLKMPDDRMVTIVGMDGKTGDILEETSISSKECKFTYFPSRPLNLTELIDGCTDIRVVTTGTLIAAGITDEAVQEITDINNLEKFGPGGHRDEGGKWIKPPNHPKPDFDPVIRALIVQPLRTGRRGIVPS